MLRAALFTLLSLIWAAPPAVAADLAHPFASIDGGDLRLSEWAGRPVLVVNTASRCGYTKQYAEMQQLYDRYRARGLVVLAVPSGDFRQELNSNAEIRAFCELTFGLDLPMTERTAVLGDEAHPFYVSLRRTHGFVPRWNFNKVLISPQGNVVATFGAQTRPLSRKITAQIEELLTP